MVEAPPEPGDQRRSQSKVSPCPIRTRKSRSRANTICLAKACHCILSCPKQLRLDNRFFFFLTMVNAQSPQIRPGTS